MWLSRYQNFNCSHILFILDIGCVLLVNLTDPEDIDHSFVLVLRASVKTLYSTT